MKTKLILLASIITTLIAVGCKSDYDKGPYLPGQSRTPDYENTERFVMLDIDMKHSITCSGIHERVLEDGRIEVTAQIRNREVRRLVVQANCVFKDAAGVSTSDETPFQNVILTENATEQVKFVSSNSAAKKYTVRVRQAR